MIISLITYLNRLTTLCPKISDTPVSNTPNSVCNLWISTKYRTLHYINVAYCHTHYDVRTLPCVLNVMSLWHQNLFTLRLRSKPCYWQRDQAAVYPP